MKILHDVLGPHPPGMGQVCRRARSLLVCHRAHQDIHLSESARIDDCAATVQGQSLLASVHRSTNSNHGAVVDAVLCQSEAKLLVMD